MSKNFPHDNIYSILGKLEALQPTPKEQHDAKVQQIRESVEAQGSILKGLREVSATEQRLQKQFAESEKWIQKTGVEKNKGGLHKALHVAQGEKIPAGKIEKATHSKNPHVRHMAQFAKNVAKEENTPDAVKAGVTEVAPPGEKAERMVKHIKKSYSKDGKLTPKEKSIAYATAWKAHNAGKVEEAGEPCNECGMFEAECSCEHTNEGSKETTKHGIRHHADPGRYGGYDPETDPDKDDKDDEPKKGRGRPKKASSEKSQAHLPWGGKPPTDKYQHQAGSYVHSVSDKSRNPKADAAFARDEKLAKGKKLKESRLMDESGEKLEHILNRFKAEVRNFEQGGDLDDDLYDALFDYWLDCGDIPYGVAKARTGDPYEWVANNLESHLRGSNIVGGNEYDEGVEIEAIGNPQPGIPGNLPPEQVPGKIDLLKGKGRSYYEESSLEEELNELAKLAGLASEGNAFTGKLKDTPKGGNFELDGKTYKDTSNLDEEETDEGNAFGAAVAKAKADGIQPGEKVKVGGKEYPVKEAQELISMLRIAGLDTQQIEEALAKDSATYGDTEVAEPESEDEEPVNSGNKNKYASMKASTMNPGEGDFGEKKMEPNKPTFKNGDNPLSKPAVNVKEDTVTLEARLAAEYESIKKVSK